MSLITIQDLSDYNNGSISISDAKAIKVVSSVNQWIESYTGRIWGRQEEITETLDYAPVIFLSKMDVTDISSIKVFDNVVDVSNVRWNKFGRILLSYAKPAYSAVGFDSVEVVYTSGVEEVPEDLKMAALQLASDFYYSVGTNTNITSASVGGYSLSFGGSSNSGSDSNGGKNGSYLSVLNLYKKYRV